MNKVATYLNDHLLGEISDAKTLKKRYSRDRSILSVAPELIAFPLVTNDIRKIARFSWQLAEKGHVLGLTARGKGNDDTGAAIGKGVVISTSTHLNNIINIASKEKLVHVQPGVTFEVMQAALKWQGLTVLNSPADHVTVGGAIAGASWGQSGQISSEIEKLEVVLANGDLIETGRISRHEVNKKLGLQTFEGEIYRKLQGLIEDNEELIKQLADRSVVCNAGYQRIGQVKAKDGSFDLTPLFIGSQGTLGIISEIVLRGEYYSADSDMLVATPPSIEDANDIAEAVIGLEPSRLEIIESDLLNVAVKAGSKFSLLGDVSQIGSAVYIQFDDFSERARHHKLKKVKKLLTKMNIGMVDSTDHQPEEFAELTNIMTTLSLTSDQPPLPLLGGAIVPKERRREFLQLIQAFASKHHIELPLRINALTGVVEPYSTLKLDSVSDKQKLFKLLSEYATLVHSLDGAHVGDGGEGRLKANAAWSELSDDEAKLYGEIRSIFDPFGTLNPDVKQKNDLRNVVSMLRSTYDLTDFVD